MSGKIIYPGTFDPVTNGHVDLVERASKLFTKVIVAIAANPKKHTIFTLEEREKMIREVFSTFKNIEICTFTGLLVEFSRLKNTFMILRGLRAISDFDYELQLASVNRMMDPKVETVFLTPEEKYAYVSASVVREVAALGGDVSSLVPKGAQVALKKKFCI